MQCAVCPVQYAVCIVQCAVCSVLDTEELNFGEPRSFFPVFIFSLTCISVLSCICRYLSFLFHSGWKFKILLPFCRFSLYFIHIILLTWTRIELFWRMIEIFIQSPGTEVEFLTFCVIIMITFNKYIAEWMQNMGKICETSHCQEIFYI